MTTSNHQTPIPPHQQKSYQQQLQQLYAYYDHRSPPKQQQQPQEPQKEFIENDDCFLYQGCDYDADVCGSDVFFEKYQYQGSYNKKQKHQRAYSDSRQASHSLTLQYQRYQYQTHYNSQPTAFNRQPYHKIPQDKQQLSANSSISHPSRSVNALVSAQKNKKKPNRAPSKATSERSVSSSLSTRNKLILQNKEKKKNGDKTIEAVFFNPLASLPFEALDVQGFQKFYKTSHEKMFDVSYVLFKENQCTPKKITILGQKAFFKDKQNEQSLDQIFKLMGFKTSSKMGKGKSFREFKAIYKYLNMDNPQGSGSKNKHLGDGATMIDGTYLSQFKELMGYKETEEEKEEACKNSLFGYGFGKLERKC